jgi:hypothetical protein
MKYFDDDPEEPLAACLQARRVNDSAPVWRDRRGAAAPAWCNKPRTCALTLD